jgi:octaprenyl-diphosphate synthase
MSHYGIHLGTAFQLIDDVLDYSASPEQIGKNIGDDLAEGKPTLPVLHALWNSQGEQASGLRQAIEKGGLEFIGQVMAAIESTGAIAYTASLAAEHARLAAAALHPLPTSQFKDALLALADFAVNRRS